MIVFLIQENIKTIRCSFAYKLVCVDDKFSKDVVLYRGKNAVFKFIQCVFKKYDYCRIVMKKHFNKNLVMTAEENEEFEKSNICWICGKLINLDENKVRDQCHITKNIEVVHVGHVSTLSTLVIYQP